jgi:uncharacterized protein (TIGR02118 family)
VTDRHDGPTLRRMTAKLTVLYATPEDPTAFEKHYLEVHMPLIPSLPGLQRAEAARFLPGPDGNPPPLYRIAELWFADTAAIQAALGSEQGAKVAADYAQIAPAGSQILIAEVDDLG